MLTECTRTFSAYCVRLPEIGSKWCRSYLYAVPVGSWAELLVARLPRATGAREWHPGRQGHVNPPEKIRQLDRTKGFDLEAAGWDRDGPDAKTFRRAMNGLVCGPRDRQAPRPAPPPCRPAPPPCRPRAAPVPHASPERNARVAFVPRTAARARRGKRVGTGDVSIAGVHDAWRAGGFATKNRPSRRRRTRRRGGSSPRRGRTRSFAEVTGNRWHCERREHVCQGNCREV